MFFLSLTLRNARKLGKFGKFFLVVRGTVPPKFGVGEGTAHASVPQYFASVPPNVTEKNLKGK